MAGPPPVKFDGFPLGLDNIRREDSLKFGSLRAAVNIDLDVNGRPARRRGVTRVVTGQVHSVTWAFGTAVMVRDGDLVAVDVETGDNTATIKSAVSGRRLQYAHTPHHTFWTDGTQLRMFNMALLDFPAWPTAPGFVNAAEVTPYGGLAEGDYQVVLTQVDAFGRESGAGRGYQFSVGHNGGILLHNLPTPADAVTLRVYITDPGGKVFRLDGEVPPGSPQYLISTNIRTIVLEHPWLQPMPPGQAVCFSMGRLFVAQDRRLYFSEPLRYGAMSPENFITFGEKITLLAPTGSGPEAGVYVAAGNRTLFLGGGNPKEAPLTAARATGAVLGSAMQVHTSTFTPFDNLPQTMASVWLSTDGVLCLGLPSGSILPLTERRVALPKNADSAATSLRVDAGYSQVVTSVSGGNGSVAGASDQLVGTIYRNGVAVVE